MSVTLAPDVEDLIREEVERGPYADPNEVIREALHALAERNRLKAIRASIKLAEEQFDRGEYTVWTPDFMEQLDREATEDDLRGKPIKADVQP